MTAANSQPSALELLHDFRETLNAGAGVRPNTAWWLPAGIPADIRTSVANQVLGDGNWHYVKFESRGPTGLHETARPRALRRAEARATRRRR